jgi:hypothetical protein
MADLRRLAGVGVLLLSCLFVRRVGAQNCQPPQPEVEPNGSMATATAMAAPSIEGRFRAAPGSIVPPGDEDFFSIAADLGDRLWLLVDTGLQTTPDASRDSLLDVYDAAGSLLESDDDDGSAVDGFGVVSEEASTIAGLRIPATGTYSIRVRAKDPAAVMDYRLLVGLTRSASTPEEEPNDLPSQANEIFSTSPTRLGSIWPGDVDYYSMNVLDNGVPLVLVDGAPSAGSPAVDAVLTIESQFGFPPPFIVDSSGLSVRPAEALRMPVIGRIRVTANLQGPGPGSYRIAGFYLGQTCVLPVTLRAFEVQ